MVIFLIASTSIVSIYYSIYENVIAIKVHQVAMGCIVKLCERIDLEPYDNITEENVANYINASGLNSLVTKGNGSEVVFTIENYANENTDQNDILKKINITVTYPIGPQGQNQSGRKISYLISKIKVRELEL